MKGLIIAILVATVTVVLTGCEVAPHVTAVDMLEYSQEIPSSLEEKGYTQHRNIWTKDMDMAVQTSPYTYVVYQEGCLDGIEYGISKEEGVYSRAVGPEICEDHSLDRMFQKIEYNLRGDTSGIEVIY